MKLRIDCIGRSDLDNYLSLCAEHVKIDIEAARVLALASLRYANGRVGPEEPDRAPLAQLEAHWYASVAAGQPDYTVYDDPRFLSDLWACWCAYSRAYLRAVQYHAMPSGKTVRDDIGDAAVVVDLGCGTGHTTEALAQLFPLADAVVGVNIRETGQYRIAHDIGVELAGGFHVVGGVSEVGKCADVVFASEYFEHFERPLEHLREVLDTLSPRCLIIANSFTANAIGHFPVYRDGADKIPNSQMGRKFNALLRHRGYEAVKTGFWNGRPAYWRRK